MSEKSKLETSNEIEKIKLRKTDKKTKPKRINENMNKKEAKMPKTQVKPSKRNIKTILVPTIHGRQNYRKMAIDYLYSKENNEKDNDLATTDHKINFINTLKRLHCCYFRNFIEAMEMQLNFDEKLEIVFKDILTRFLELECC